MPPPSAPSDYLYIASSNIISGVTGDAVTYSSSCTGGPSINTVSASPGITSLTGDIDPRPACGSAAYSGAIDASGVDSFYDQAMFKGAFGNVNWLDGWSAMTFATGSS